MHGMPLDFYFLFENDVDFVRSFLHVNWPWWNGHDVWVLLIGAEFCFCHNKLPMLLCRHPDPSSSAVRAFPMRAYNLIVTGQTAIANAPRGRSTPQRITHTHKIYSKQLDR